MDSIFFNIKIYHNNNDTIITIAKAINNSYCITNPAGGAGGIVSEEATASWILSIQ